VATDRSGVVLATGRNRVLELDAGDDLLAGTSVAHAEMNVLAKLPFRRYADDEVTVFTTLQPCVQCLGAIRLSTVARVHVLAPDPLFRGIESALRSHEFVERNWPVIDQLAVTPWSVLSLLFPTHLGVFWRSSVAGWLDPIPTLGTLARDLVTGNDLIDLAADGAGLDDVATSLWDRLADCVAEVARLAGAA
jgi:tRNA(Arg) A34 adenosine deaminase TadA